MKKNKTNKQQGSILVFTLIVTMMMTVTIIGVITVSATQRRSSVASDKSVTAFQNADRGVEEIMLALQDPDVVSDDIANIASMVGGSCGGGEITRDESGETVYTASFFNLNGDKISDCSADITDIIELKSVGENRTATRAVQLSVFLDIRDGLVAQWNFEEDNADLGEVFDASGEGNDGALEGYTAIQESNSRPSGAVGNQALELFGDDEYVSTEEQIDDDNLTTYSLSAWFKTSADEHKIIGYEMNQTGEVSTSYDRHIYIGENASSESGHLVYGVWDGSAQLLFSDSPVNDDQWHHVVVTQNENDGNEAVMYIDGVEVDRADGYEPWTNYVSDGYWRMGSFRTWSTSSPTGYFDGLIDDVRIYDRALSEEEVFHLCRLGKNSGVECQTP
ncbi:MAG: hypothetical protein KC736_05005 [Candidatus Moranbacteria bacterium]|nr:hypothetical protein [Candidatus Moranbacteria bacterium]